MEFLAAMALLGVSVVSYAIGGQGGIMLLVGTCCLLYALTET